MPACSLGLTKPLSFGWKTKVTIPTSPSLQDPSGHAPCASADEKNAELTWPSGSNHPKSDPRAQSTMNPVVSLQPFCGETLDIVIVYRNTIAICIMPLEEQIHVGVWLP